MRWYYPKWPVLYMFVYAAEDYLYISNIFPLNYRFSGKDCLFDRKDTPLYTRGTPECGRFLIGSYAFALCIMLGSDT